MASDLKINIDGTWLNIRAGLIMKFENKIVIELSRLGYDPIIPGGRIRIGEKGVDTLMREICEEMGFVFAAAVIVLFIALIWRGVYIAGRAPTPYATLMVMGLIMQVGIQVILNIAVVTNTLPSTGVSLPFFSYGGTSLFIVMAEMGLILNISRYSLLEKG